MALSVQIIMTEQTIIYFLVALNATLLLFSRRAKQKGTLLFWLNFSKDGQSSFESRKSHNWCHKDFSSLVFLKWILNFPKKTSSRTFYFIFLKKSMAEGWGIPQRSRGVVLLLFFGYFSFFLFFFLLHVLKVKELKDYVSILNDDDAVRFDLRWML